ncbi:hypothetical protein [Salinicola avicenniae]|uniref:hypothetical protein n=1 Tax=Salinicola avicenniae TaxID=2916836 RepID=UPI0020741924|nr:MULTISPECIES: hypothetical protein [unclassified Salinicola]
MRSARRVARQLDAPAACSRLRSYGAERFESAWLTLWAAAIGRRGGEPRAWLMATTVMPQALLLPHSGALEATGEDDGALQLDAGGPPPLAQFERWWLWERLGRPRQWALRVQPETLCAVDLPLWLGYSEGRQTQLIVLSGLSGEALGALKPAVLSALHRLSSPADHLSERGVDRV